MREYVVALNKHVEYDTFWDQIETETFGLDFIPDRAVEIANNRDGSLRQCHYFLTDEEAQILMNDERVYCVEIPPEQRDDIQIIHHLTQYSNFSKTTYATGSFVNWGLLRANYPSNIFGTSTNPALGVTYDYTLNGTGVDVVIQDSGLQVDHPEFQDSNGNTRVKQIDWAAASGLGFTQNANHYRDYAGHGTHVAGIVAGKTYGWAKNANIYSLKVSGLEGSGDSGTGISVTYAFDAIKLWHAAKPIQSSTGCKIPTVVNMSWGYSTSYNSVTSITYRTNTFTTGSATTDSLWRYTNCGIVNDVDASGNGATYIANTRVGTVDVDLQELVDAGVIVCVSAGNNCFMIDKSTGPDYNNHMSTDSGTLYYHRGSSPYDSKAIIVGCLDYVSYDSISDQRAYFSCTGTGVDLYSPGTYIMSATSNTNEFGSAANTYFYNSSYKQANISGTSMASPQVAGVAALMLQLNPTASAASIKSAIVNKAPKTAYTGSITSSYLSQYRSLLQGSPSVLYNPFEGAYNILITGSINISANIKIS